LQTLFIEAMRCGNSARSGVLVLTSTHGR
jgi:hypothetical protein